MNRRDFVQLSSAALLSTSSSSLLASYSGAQTITSHDGTIRVQGESYLWEYSQAQDRFSLFDSSHRTIVSGKLQPAIVVAPCDRPHEHLCTPGQPTAPTVEPNKITFHYTGVNDSARVTFSWRFDQSGIWTDPIQYESTEAHDIVSLHYFADNDGTTRKPSLHPTFVVIPGVISGSTVSPILHNGDGINQNVWMGRGSSSPGFSQQWGLPVHFFSGFSTPWPGPERNLYSEHMSEAFTCGLAQLPAGDFYLDMLEGSVSPWIDYRSDLWQHLRTTAGEDSRPVVLGATFFWSVAPEYRESIAAYYKGLLQAGVIRKRQHSALKTAVALTPQFCTWGAQRARGQANDKLNEAFLTEIYGEMKAAGMQAGLFSIDDKWEAAYGNLEHSTERFPHFEQFFDRLRADGMRIGIWAAVMRCEKPSDLGLSIDQMLKRPDDKPFIAHGAGNSSYYILDFTRPEVANVLSEVVRRFMRRYKPDLFKFDFGYELPSMAIAAPHDRQWAGERLMWKGLEIVISAMREENPDIVVMYYNLSPLFLDFIDIHSTDDLWMDIGDYQIEANRRLYFSSLLGPLGVTTYGSSGYDWSSSPSIWFDSAALGSIGSLNDFVADEEGESATPDLIAKYNGITHTLRPTTTFEILPLDTVPLGPTIGAHARSWARLEGGQLTLLAWRPPVPGEENLLAEAHTARFVDPRLLEVVHSTVPVIVASKTDQDITRSNSLAIVSYGSGEIILRRKQGKQAQITRHYFRGATDNSSSTILNNQLRFTVDRSNASGSPLEWIEVHVTE